jgi:hypothetical protein
MIRLFFPDPDPYFSPIPGPGSRGQKGTGSQIADPDPQHCIYLFELLSVHRPPHPPPSPPSPNQDSSW